MNKAVFLDRDGVINRKAPQGDYIVRWQEFEILPGVVEAIRNLNQVGYEVIIVTNQRGVAKNKITITEWKRPPKTNCGSRPVWRGHRPHLFCPHEIGE